MSEPSNQSLDFAVIGAQKCATSWMYYCLKDHPQICVPTKKREVAYLGGALAKENGVDWFFDRFQCSDNQVRGDVSVVYLYDADSAEVLKAHMPQPKLIVSLRNPVDRFVSSYYWLCRSGILPDQEINTWINSLPDSSWSTKLGDDAAQVILRGFYADQLKGYLNCFSPKSFLILLYEDIQECPMEAIQRVYRFLNIDDEFVPPNLAAKPKQNSYNRWLLYIERKFKSKLTSHVVNLAHQFLSRGSRKSAPISQQSRDKLCSIFSVQTQELISLLGSFPENQRPSTDDIRARWEIASK
ncbi:MAG: sulfotransferase domain-containing protein [Pirellulaceae bacterium]